MAEIQSPDFPNERLIACRNPQLAEERARKRTELLAATEAELAKVAVAAQRNKNPLQGKDKIGLRVGKVLGKYKVGKHFHLEISETSFTFSRRTENIAAESSLDGIYVVRTSVPDATLAAEDAVATYKSLSRVERAFRCTKTVDLKVRPIHHYLPERVRAHVLICMLAYYVEWHMRRALAPLLFDDEHKDEAEALRESVVAKAQRSPQAKKKDKTERNADGEPVQSFRDVLKMLRGVAKNRIQPKLKGNQALRQGHRSVPPPAASTGPPGRNALVQPMGRNPAVLPHANEGRPAVDTSGPRTVLLGCAVVRVDSWLSARSRIQSGTNGFPGMIRVQPECPHFLT